MPTMIALLKREWQEHVAGFGWGPVAVLAVVVLMTCSSLALVGFGSATIHYSSDVYDEAGHHREEVEVDDSLTSLSRFIDYNSWSDTELDTNTARFRIAVARPFELIYLLIAVFVLLGALYEERRDRSVLFWKSMPVSDSESVLSKLIAAVWLAPVAVIGAIFLAQVFLLTVLSGLIWSHELGSVARLWWHSGLLVGIIELVVGYAIQGLWALPLYSWLLAVSAAAPRVPFVWAIVIPLAAVVVEQVTTGTATIRAFVVGHAELIALPNTDRVENGVGKAAVGLSQQLDLLLNGQLWLGVVVGAALLWAAVYFRRRNNDL